METNSSGHILAIFKYFSADRNLSCLLNPSFPLNSELLPCSVPASTKTVTQAGANIRPVLRAHSSNTRAAGAHGRTVREITSRPQPAAATSRLSVKKYC